MKLRIDKFVWFVRITKTRNDATELVKQGRIKLNSSIVKPSKELLVNDLIQVKKHNATYTYKVIKIPDKRLGPTLVAEYILDLTPENEKKNLQEYLLVQKEYRQFGTGKPTKKQRRLLVDIKK